VRAVARADYAPAVLTNRIGRRAVFANAVLMGRPVFDVALQRKGHPGDHRARRRRRKDHAMTSRDPNSAFVTRTRDPDTWVGERNTNASITLAKADPRASRLSIGSTPVLRGAPRSARFGAGTPPSASNHSVNLFTSDLRGSA